MEDFSVLAVGEPFPGDLFDTPGLTWQRPALLVMVVEGSAQGKRPAPFPTRLPVRYLRAFTTSPAMTRTLRRLMAGLRAAGPLPRQEATDALTRDMDRLPGGGDAWRRCLITSKVGR